MKNKFTFLIIILLSIIYSSVFAQQKLSKKQLKKKYENSNIYKETEKNVYKMK